MSAQGVSSVGEARPRGAVVAQMVLGAGRPGDVRLFSPSQRHAWVGEDIILLGFPASPSGVPWGELGSEEAASLARSAMKGEARLKGGWTLVGVDEDELVVRTDPYGTRPLFVRSTSTMHLVSEEIWPLLDESHQLDAVGVADFLVVGHHLGTRTGFADVTVTPPDALLRFARSGVTRRTFVLPMVDRAHMSLREASDGLAARLAALFNPYRDVNRLLIGLSGGLDSRVLLGVAADAGLDVHAWTFTLVKRSEEEALARRVARTLDVGHTVSHVGVEAVSSSARSFVKASSGQQSLEHVHGYPSRHEPPAAYSVHVDGIIGGAICGGSLLPPSRTGSTTIAEAATRFLLAGRSAAQLQKQLPGIPEWSPRLDDLLDTWYARVGRSARRADLAMLQNRTSRMSVWWSISARDRFEFIAPFLDDDLVEWAWGMPEEFQRRAVAYRETISRSWPLLARIPWEKTGLPITRYPGRLSRRIRSIRRWYGIGRPIAYFDRKIYAAAFAPLADRAEESLRPVLAELGVDLDGLLREFDKSRQALQLRVASVYLMLEEARSGTAGGAHVTTLIERSGSQ